jgi:hypothetical protein
MSQRLDNFLWGSFYLVAGSVILLNLEAIVRFDQNSGLRLKSWFNKKLGKSFLNRELWSVGTPTGFKSSRIVFRIVSILCLVYGAVLLVLAFREYLR